MIHIKKSNSYLKDFTKELFEYLESFLNEIINTKRLLGPINKVKSNHTKNKDINVYSLHDDGIDRYQKILFRISTNEISFFKKTREYLEFILKANSITLRRVIKKLYKKKHQLLDINSNISKIIKYIFVDKGYLYKISKMNEKKIAYKLVKELDIKTCPYCNRSYISFVKNEEKQTRPQLDHFYPKSIYPFLACSFYNLIPSCSACNHMKSDDDSYKDEISGKLINPYNVKDDDFRFSYTLNDLKITEITAKKDIAFDYESSIKVLINTKYHKNMEYFQLEEIYQNHQDIVIELILKEINYPKSYVKELQGFDFSQDEIYRYLFANYSKEEDLHRRPLSKLIKDISEELELI